MRGSASIVDRERDHHPLVLMNGYAMSIAMRDLFEGLIQSRMQVRAIRMPSAGVFSSPLDVGDPKHVVDLNIAQPGFVREESSRCAQLARRGANTTRILPRSLHCCQKRWNRRIRLGRMK